MYSIVLMAVLTPGPDLGFGGKHAAPVVTGCSGCAGYSCSGYVAGCYGSCYGSCHGGLFHHRAGCHGLFGHRHSCHGCCGYSCSGWSCFGSCTGVGSCNGYSLGCCGGWSSGYWAPMYSTNPTDVYGSVTNPNPVPVETKKDEKKDNKQGANIKFQLPADAKLYVDGRLTGLTGTERGFVTPSLGEGKFFYDVKAELTIDGQTVVEQKRVVVEAGASLVESFPKLIAAADAKRDAVAGK